jgi:hypothetical protein
MPKCQSKSKTPRECAQTGKARRSECTEVRDDSYKACEEWRDEKFSECKESADHGYNACDNWKKNCCTWQPCAAICKSFSWVCTAFVWVSNVVCVVTVWLVHSVCLTWVLLSHLVCVAFTWVAVLLCVAWAAIVWLFVSICCAKPLGEGLLRCWGPTKDMPRNDTAKDGWILTFEDDFEKGTIDYTKWIDHMSFLGRFADGNYHGLGNADFVKGKFPALYYSPEFTFGDSTVKLIADNTPMTITIPPAFSMWSGQFKVPYTVQALQWRTDPLMEQRHGYFEIRCKTQNARDMWPAFWLFPVTPFKGPPKTWPPEIDIFEFMSRKPSIFTMTQHWGLGPGHPSQSKRHRACRAGKRFHIYACEWDETHIRWYLDNKRIHVTNQGIDDFIYPMSIIVNSGIDFSDCREPRKSRYPNYLEVDYVRVYKRQ